MKKIFAILLSVMFIAGCSNSIDNDSAKLALLNLNKNSSGYDISISIVPESYNENSRTILPTGSDERFVECVKAIKQWDLDFGGNCIGDTYDRYPSFSATGTVGEDGKIHIKSGYAGNYDLTVNGKYVSEDKTESYNFSGKVKGVEFGDTVNDYTVDVGFESYGKGKFSALITGFDGSRWPTATKTMIENSVAAGKIESPSKVFDFQLASIGNSALSYDPDSTELIYTEEGILKGVKVSYSKIDSDCYKMKLTYNWEYAAEGKTGSVDVMLDVGEYAVVADSLETYAECTAIYADISDGNYYYASGSQAVTGNGSSPAMRAYLWTLLFNLFDAGTSGTVYCDDFIFDIRDYNYIRSEVHNKYDAEVVIRYQNGSICSIHKTFNNETQTNDYSVSVTNSFAVKGYSEEGQDTLEIEDYTFSSSGSYSAHKFTYESDVPVTLKIKAAGQFFTASVNDIAMFGFLFKDISQYLSSGKTFFEYTKESYTSADDKFENILNSKVVIQTYDTSSRLYIRNSNFKIDSTMNESGNHLNVALSGDMLHEDINSKYYIAASYDDQVVFADSDEDVVSVKQNKLKFYVYSAKNSSAKLTSGTYTLMGWELNGKYLIGESTIAGQIELSYSERTGFYIDISNYAKYLNLDGKNVIRCIIKKDDVYSSAQMYFDLNLESAGSIYYVTEPATTTSSGKLRALYKGTTDVSYEPYSCDVYDSWTLSNGITILECRYTDDTRDIIAVRQLSNGMAEKVYCATMKDTVGAYPYDINYVTYDGESNPPRLWISAKAASANNWNNTYVIYDPFDKDRSEQWCSDTSVIPTAAGSMQDNDLMKYISVENGFRPFAVKGSNLYYYSEDSRYITVLPLTLTTSDHTIKVITSDMKDITTLSTTSFDGYFSDKNVATDMCLKYDSEQLKWYLYVLIKDVSTTIDDTTAGTGIYSRGALAIVEDVDGPTPIVSLKGQLESQMVSFGGEVTGKTSLHSSETDLFGPTRMYSVNDKGIIFSDAGWNFIGASEPVTKTITKIQRLMYYDFETKSFSVYKDNFNCVTTALNITTSDDWVIN